MGEGVSLQGNGALKVSASGLLALGLVLELGLDLDLMLRLLFSASAIHGVVIIRGPVLLGRIGGLGAEGRDQARWRNHRSPSRRKCS